MSKHILSFDVEDWSQGFIQRGIDGWQVHPSRDKESIEKIIGLLNEFGVQATFFVVGAFAERHPDIVRLLASQGHEIATHGYAHLAMPMLSREGFREDLHRSISILEDIVGVKITGHRAARWSMSRKVLWAIESMLSEGIEYDSSIFPTRIHSFGLPDVPARPFLLELSSGESIIEFPAQVLTLGFLRIPVAGGFYMRAAPASFSIWALRQSTKRGAYGMVYLHPYDLDAEPPRVNVPFPFRVLRYYNLSKTEPLLRLLLQKFEFCSVRKVLSESTFVARSHRVANIP
jgi:polysaccharide deacetylase family protein (PEP-CTERM system associated)